MTGHEIEPCPDHRAAAAHAAGKDVVIFVLGGPGAGKGTQCANIARDYGYVHLSAGDCLREERNSGSADADLINRHIAEGSIVPVEITIKLLLRKMDKSPAGRFLVDGFPRNLNNLEGWQSAVGKKKYVPFVLFFDAPEAVMEGRLLERGKTSGRVDDNLAAIKRRFKTYADSTFPIIERFAAEGRVRKVDAVGSMDDVYARVRKIMDEFEQPAARWCLQYHVQSRAHLQQYFARKERSPNPPEH